MTIYIKWNDGARQLEIHNVVDFMLHGEEFIVYVKNEGEYIYPKSLIKMLAVGM